MGNEELRFPRSSFFVNDYAYTGDTVILHALWR